MDKDTADNARPEEVTGIERLAESGRIFRATGLPGMVLSRLVRRGKLRRIARGVYVGGGVDLHPLWQAAALSIRVPRIVVCLLSALEYYELTTAWTDGLWIMVPRNQNTPKVHGVHVVRVVPAMVRLDVGIERVDVHGVPVSITSRHRTVVDCWRHSRRVPFSTAIEALRRLRGSPEWNGRELYHCARELGAWKKMRPYVEGLG